MRLGNIFKKVVKQEEDPEPESKDVAKERLQLVLMQDRANVSAEFLEMMKNEIISVVQKYIDVDEEAMDIRLTTEPNEDGTNGIPKIYANIPIIQIKNESKFGRLQIQNEAGELIGEIGGNKEISKFAEINEGEIFQDDDNEDDIEIESTVIDRKEVQKEPEEVEVAEEEVEEVEEVEDVEEVEEPTIENVEEVDMNSLEDSIDELEEYFEENDDDVTFDDLLKAAEEAENNSIYDELDNMKRVVEESSKEYDEELDELEEDDEDSLLQQLSDIDEEDDEIERKGFKHSSGNVTKNSNYVPKRKKNRNKR